MRKKSHPDAVTTLDFLARVAAAYALVSDDLSMVRTPATAWWNLRKLYDLIPPISEPRWVMWVDDINNGIWPDAPNSDLTEICMALQSFPSGTLIINMKNLCDLREADPTAVHLPRGVLRQYLLDEHNRHRADNNIVRLISEEHKLVLHNAIASDVNWHDAWLTRPGAAVDESAKVTTAPELLEVEL